MTLFQHTDEDGDRIRLVELNVPNAYRFIISGDEIKGAVVDITDLDLFRLRDVIESISVGDPAGNLPGKTVR